MQSVLGVYIRKHFFVNAGDQLSSKRDDTGENANKSLSTPGFQGEKRVMTKKKDINK